MILYDENDKGIIVAVKITSCVYVLCMYACIVKIQSMIRGASRYDMLDYLYIHWISTVMLWFFGGLLVIRKGGCSSL